MAAIFFPDCENSKFKNKESREGETLLEKGRMGEAGLSRAAALDLQCQSLIRQKCSAFVTQARILPFFKFLHRLGALLSAPGRGICLAV